MLLGAVKKENSLIKGLDSQIQKLKSMFNYQKNVQVDVRSTGVRKEETHMSASF